MKFAVGDVVAPYQRKQTGVVVEVRDDSCRVRLDDEDGTIRKFAGPVLTLVERRCV